MTLPIGYGWSPSHDVVMEPDEQARGVVQLIFEKLAELGTGHAVFLPSAQQRHQDGRATA